MAIVEDIYFQGFPFPCVLLFQDGSTALSGGALFPPPPFTTHETQFNFYRSCKTGWGTCPLGFATYKFSVIPERDTKLVVFGLKVSGVSTIQGKSASLSIKTTTTDVERLSKNVMASINTVEARLQSIVSSGVHEFRNVNKDLYNIAYRLEQALFDHQNSEHREMAKSIVELSEMMRSRSDIFDVITNPSIARIQDQTIHVYRAFDRARKSITSSSDSRKVSLRMKGLSTSRAQAVQMFDVVPYILLQNAVKYSPDKFDVDITVVEDKEHIYATVESLGPALKNDEQQKVFQPGFRGQLAEKFESQGSGMGLFVVQRLIDFCNGASVVMGQWGSSQIIQNIEFRHTKLELVLRRSHNNKL